MFSYQAFFCKSKFFISKKIYQIKMKKINFIRNLTESEFKLMSIIPTYEELEARKILDKVNYFYSVVSSNKKIFLEALKLNFYPIGVKLLQKIRKIKDYKFINYGFISGYRFNHIEKIFRNKSQIKIVYEFGSGASTILFAKLLKEQFIKTGVKGIIYTYEQSREYLNDLKSHFSKDLLEYVNFNLCDLTYYLENNFRLLKYDIKEYHQEIDLVYIDGPTHQLFANLPPPPRYQANGNIIEMMKLNNFKFGFSDKRFYYYLVYKLNNYNMDKWLKWRKNI
jgi:phospholipid N-methyltransferase